MIPFLSMRLYNRNNYHLLQPFIEKMKNNQLTIENILENDDIVQDLKTNQNSQFLYMISNEVIRKLIDYATKMPSSDDQKIGHKYPFNAAEILSCDNNGIIERIMNEIKYGEQDSEDEEKEREEENGGEKKDENEENEAEDYVEVKEDDNNEENEKKDEEDKKDDEEKEKKEVEKEGGEGAEAAKEEEKKEDNKPDEAKENQEEPKKEEEPKTVEEPKAAEEPK